MERWNPLYRLIKVADDYDNNELTIHAGIDVITADSISSPNITSIIIEEGVRKFDSSAISCPNLRTIKFPKTLAEYYLEEIRGISFSELKHLGKILIPKGMCTFFLMYCSANLYHLLVEYDEQGIESPIKPLNDDVKHYYEKIHSYGFPDYLHYSLLKIELQKGIALSEDQIYAYFKEMRSSINIYYNMHIDIMYRFQECFRRDGLSLKTIKSKDKEGKEVELYYLESPKSNE